MLAIFRFDLVIVHGHLISDSHMFMVFFNINCVLVDRYTLLSNFLVAWKRILLIYLVMLVARFLSL